HGTNDVPNNAPKIVQELTTATGSVTEDTDVNSSNQIASSGTITFEDVDLIDTHTASFVPHSSSSSAPLPGFTNGSTYIGTFSLDPVSEDNTDTNDIGSVGWTFTGGDSDPTLQSLAGDQTLPPGYTGHPSHRHRR